MKQLFLFFTFFLLISTAGSAQFLGFYTYNDVAVSRQGKVVAVGGPMPGIGPMVTSLGTHYIGWSPAMGIDWQGEKFIVIGNKLGRFNTDGTSDQSFGNGGTVSIAGTDLKILCNGKIVTAGGSITRLLPDGATDLSFGTNGIANASFPITKIAVTPDAKIVAIGDHQVARFNENGTADIAFIQAVIPQGVDFFSELAIQTDGKILVSATYSTGNGMSDFALLRFNTDGSLDNSFSGDGLVTLDINHNNDNAVSVGLQADGKILVAGTAVIFQCPCPTVPNISMAVARFTESGILDESFGEATTIPVYNSGPPYAVIFDGKGKTVLGSLLMARAMAMYQDSIYLAGSTARSSKGDVTNIFLTSLHNDTYPLAAFNNASFNAMIPDTYALSKGTWPNTVYLGYAPASSIRLTAQTYNTGPYTYAWNTGATTKSISVSPTSNTTYSVTITEGSGCSVNISKTIAVTDVHCGNKNDKVELCQANPSGKPNSICVSGSAVPAQLARGAYLGNCITGAQQEAVTKFGSITGNGLKVFTLNNPSHSGFIVDVQSANNTDRVNIYIYNAEGKVKEKLTINANTRFEVGNN
ncbi:MAG TPA: delta-60 repeat domain-containing protein, partial [Flavisolibacter sp.]|nr:delta-60 repeat domain-containing protein [Flavisolibacter sp.]